MLCRNDRNRAVRIRAFQPAPTGLNVFPAVKGGDFSSESLTFQADTDGVTGPPAAEKPPALLGGGVVVPKARTLSLGVARGRKLPADGLHRIAVQTKFCHATRAQLDQVESARPMRLATGCPAILRLTLDLAAVVPHAIDGPTVAVEVLANRCVLEPIAVSENHVSRLIGLPGECKTTFYRRQVTLPLPPGARRWRWLSATSNNSAPPPRRGRGFRRGDFR